MTRIQIMLPKSPGGLPMHAGRSLGVCHYCGRIEAMTRDHVTPKYLRQKNVPADKVNACVSCNQEKGDIPYAVWRDWLLTEDGYWYLWFRHQQQGIGPQYGCEVRPVDGYRIVGPGVIGPDDPERHFCAAHKPCGVLRLRMAVIGDGRSVWTNERVFDCDPPRRGHGPTAGSARAFAFATIMSNDARAEEDTEDTQDSSEVSDTEVPQTSVS